MAQIVCNMSLDVALCNGEQSLMAKQGDRQNRLLCITLTDCGKPLKVEKSATVLLNVSKGEATGVFEGQITEEGKALFAIPNMVTAEVGVAKCDVSVIGRNGGRLTSVAFAISVEPTVCPSGEVGLDADASDLAAAFIASERILSLTPEVAGEGYLLRPLINRRYALDLSDAAYLQNGNWRAFRLELPTPVSSTRENWVQIYCHAPLTASGAIEIDLDGYLLADGNKPRLAMADFELVCTYSPAAHAWMVGVVQYAKKE